MRRKGKRLLAVLTAAVMCTTVFSGNGRMAFAEAEQQTQEEQDPQTEDPGEVITESPISEESVSADNEDTDIQKEAAQAAETETTQTPSAPAQEEKATEESALPTQEAQKEEPLEEETTSEQRVDESQSVYIVTESEETHYTATYEFYDPAGTEPIGTQILSAEEILQEPSRAADSETAKFLGWYRMDDPSGELFTGFGKKAAELAGSQDGTLTESTVTRLVAKYETVYYVFYKASADSDSQVIFTQSYREENQKILTDDVPFTAAPGKELIGWTTVSGEGQEPQTDLQIQKEDVTLYPVVKEAYRLIFHSMGGTTVKPQIVLSGKNTQAPEPPSREGYTFLGWYEDEACTKAFAFGGALAATTELYAKWEAAQAEYSVIYWQENAEDDGYSYVERAVRTGNTGEAATYEEKTYPYFTLDTEKSSAEVTISGDGTTIKNVYYKRDSYTLTFKVAGNVVKTVAQKYDSDITALWETDPIQAYLDQGYVWESAATGDYYCFLQKMPGQNIIMTAEQWSGELYEINYYTETLSGDKGDRTISSRNYKLYHRTTVYTDGLSLSADEDYFPISGFTQRDTDAKGKPKVSGFVSRKKGEYYADLCYLRNSYQIHYNTNGGEAVEAAKYQYEEDISGAEPAAYERGVTTKQESGTTYVFDGWYDNESCAGDVYVFTGKTMPAKDLIFYAKWVKKSAAVTFDTKDGSAVLTQTVAQGEALQKPENPVREGYVFAGWVDEDGEPFSFETEVLGDVTVFAVWNPVIKYAITYDVNGGQTTEAGKTTCSDPRMYVDGAEAKLLAMPENWTAPTEQEGFICWNTQADGNGTDYYPGDVYTMPAGGVTLYAKWAQARRTSLTYDYNGGTDRATGNGKVTVEISVPNDKYYIPSERAGAEAVREGYTFAGWTLDPQGNGEVLNEAAAIQVDTVNPASNVLFAKWQPNAVVTPTPAGNAQEEPTATPVDGSQEEPTAAPTATISPTVSPAEEVTSPTAAPATTSAENAQTTSAPKTGDESPITFWAVMMAVTAAGALLSLRKRIIQ